MTGDPTPITSMAKDGGMVLVTPEGGRPRLECPVLGCGWGTELTDLGEFVDLGVTEASVWGHLATHTMTEWLRTVGALGGDLRRAEQWRAERVPRCCAIEAAHLGGATRLQAKAVLMIAEEQHARHV